MRYFKVYAAEILSDSQFVSLTAEEMGVWVRIMAYITRNGTFGYLVSKSNGEPVKYDDFIQNCIHFGIKNDRNQYRNVQKLYKIVNRLIQIGIFHFRKDGAFGCPGWHKLYSEYERKKLARESDLIAQLSPKCPDTDTQNVRTLRKIKQTAKIKSTTNTNKNLINLTAVNNNKDVQRYERAGVVDNSAVNPKSTPPVDRLHHGIPKTTALQLLDQLWTPQESAFQPLRERLISLLDQFSPETQLRGMLQFKSRVMAKDMPDKPYSFLKAVLVRMQTEEDRQLIKRRKDIQRMIEQGVVFSKCCGYTAAQVEYKGKEYSVCPACNSVLDRKGMSTGKDLNGNIIGQDDAEENEPDGSPF